MTGVTSLGVGVERSEGQHGATGAKPGGQSAEVSTAASMRDDVKYLRSILQPDKQGKVNEEQLFAGILEERVKILKGRDAALRFHAVLEERKALLGRAANAVENAARRALMALVGEGKISQAEATSLHSEAFAAAQLDANAEALFDSVGSRSDRTVAVKPIDTAVNGAIARLNDFDSGRAIARRREVREVSS